VNVTALFTTAKVELIAGAVAGGAASYISVFTGRSAGAEVEPPYDGLVARRDRRS
jgi:transaldolase